jgi:hypothetical protein
MVFDQDAHNHAVLDFAEELQALLIPMLQKHKIASAVDGLLLSASALALAVSSGSKMSGLESADGPQQAEELKNILSNNLRRFIREECGLTERN